MISSGGLSSRRRTMADDVADGEPDRDPADDAEHEARARLPRREGPRHGGDDRRPQQHERGAVVDQALALDHVEQPPGHAEAAADRGRGDRVGRRDDGAENERLRPASGPRPWCATTATPAVVAITSADREQRDRLDALPQLAQAGEERRLVEQRRQDPDRARRPAASSGGGLRARSRSGARRARAGSGRARAAGPEDQERRRRHQQQEQLELLPSAELVQHVQSAARPRFRGQVQACSASNSIAPVSRRAPEDR